jgi:hypothetical protein
VAGDVKDEADAHALVEAAVGPFGGLDIAFNNAGTLGAIGATTDVATQAWRDTIDTNLTSAFLAAKSQLPAMLSRGGGSMVFTSSFVGYTAGLPQMAAYAASKAGLIGLTQALAIEFIQRSRVRAQHRPDRSGHEAGFDPEKAIGLNATTVLILPGSEGKVPPTVSLSTVPSLDMFSCSRRALPMRS